MQQVKLNKQTNKLPRGHMTEVSEERSQFQSPCSFRYSPRRVYLETKDNSVLLSKQ